MNKRFVRQLHEELPRLVGAGVLDEAAARRLREHYGAAAGRSGLGVALVVFSILGSVLIGAGIILLLAHNWEGLSRPVRTAAALAPLLAAQALGLHALRRPAGPSAARREGVGAFQFLAVGAAIALVGQTYHLPGDPGAFLLTWMLLGLPLVYALRATTPCILYLAGITAWAGYAQSQGLHALGFWPLLAAAVPHLVLAWRRDPYSVRSSVVGWAMALCLCVATGISLEKTLPGLWVVVYAALFGVMYLCGAYWFGAAPTVWRRPLHAVGAGGIAVMALFFTFEFPWQDVGWHHYRHAWRYHAAAAWFDYVLALALPAAALLLLVTAVRRRAAGRILYGIFPLLAVPAYLVCSANWDWAGAAAMLAFNAYLLALGVGTLAGGLRAVDLATVNGGMLVLAALFVARFFDAELGFLARGIAFIVIGALFLGANLWLGRRRARATAGAATPPGGGAGEGSA